MSAKVVAAAADNRAAFDPTPPPDSLHVCHVPFERLVGVGELETVVARRAQAYDRIALTGPIGCGKSSVARYALREWNGPIAPIWINVATEDHEKIATVRGFLEILVSQLAARAARAQQIPDERRRQLLVDAQPVERLGSIDTRTAGELGGSYWLLSGKLARDVTRTLPLGEIYRATEDVRQAARDALAIVADGEKVPVLVCDDTDRLLSVAMADERRELLFKGFFGDVLRDLSEHLDCGLVLAAQDTYRGRADYAEITAGLVEEIAIPPLTSADQLGQIITARIEFVDASATFQDLIDPDGLERLLQLHVHDHHRSIRKTLAVLRAGLALAGGDGAEFVTRSYIEAAAAA